MGTSPNSYWSRDLEYSPSKPEWITRIAVLGDSITFGLGVELENSYHKLLEKELNRSSDEAKFEVPSFNMGAADTVWAIDKYLKQVRNFHPDIVILGFCLNDILDYSQFELSSQQILDNTPLELRIIGSFLRLHYLLRRYSHLYFMVVERSKPFMYRHFLDIRRKNPDYWIPIETDTPEYKKRFESTVQKLVEFSRIVAEDGARLIVVIFPYEIQLSDRHVDLYVNEYRLQIYSDAPKAEVQRQLIEALKANSIEYIDLLAPYRTFSKEHPDTPMFFSSIVGVVDWMHPNEKGHQVAADSIAEYLAQHSKPHR
jgi:lysophospholipase L1-like esterase